MCLNFGKSKYNMFSRGHLNALPCKTTVIKSENSKFSRDDDYLLKDATVSLGVSMYADNLSFSSFNNNYAVMSSFELSFTKKASFALILLYRLSTCIYLLLFVLSKYKSLLHFNHFFLWLTPPLTLARHVT